MVGVCPRREPTKAIFCPAWQNRGHTSKFSNGFFPVVGRTWPKRTSPFSSTSVPSGFFHAQQPVRRSVSVSASPCFSTRTMTVLPSSTSGSASITAKIRPGAGSHTAASSTFTCWLICEMGWLTCFLYSRYAPSDPYIVEHTAEQRRSPPHAAVVTQRGRCGTGSPWRASWHRNRSAAVAASRYAPFSPENWEIALLSWLKTFDDLLN